MAVLFKTVLLTFVQNVEYYSTTNKHHDNHTKNCERYEKDFCIPKNRIKILNLLILFDCIIFITIKFNGV